MHTVGDEWIGRDEDIMCVSLSRFRRSLYAAVLLYVWNYVLVLLIVSRALCMSYGWEESWICDSWLDRHKVWLTIGITTLNLALANTRGVILLLTYSIAIGCVIVFSK